MIREAIGVGETEVLALEDAKDSSVLTNPRLLSLRLFSVPRKRNSVFLAVHPLR